MLRRLTIFVSLVFALSSCAAGGQARPSSVETEQFIGMKSNEVEEYFQERFDNYYMEVTTLDYSPAGRIGGPSTYDDEILAVEENAVPSNAESMTVWSLAMEEANWYRKHPSMPKIKKGRDCTAVSGYGTKFAKPQELIFDVWDPRVKHPKGDSLGIFMETLQDTWPYEEASAERADFLKLESSRHQSYIVSGQYPKAGKPLRMGQLMAIYCTPGEQPPAEGEYNEVPIPDGPDDGDDDFDFPDKLCPTRFC